MAWSPLQQLVSLDQAKSRLKLPLDSDAEDDDLELQLQIAHEVVMDFLTQRVSDQDAWQATVDAWDDVTAPRRVVGAILEQFAFQYRFRGDDESQLRRQGDEVLCPNAVALLHRLRDPAVS